MEGTLASKRCKYLTVIFVVTVVVIFGVAVFTQLQEDKLRLFAVATEKTLFVSVVPIFLFSIACRSSYFWKFLAVYSGCGFIALFLTYLCFSRGEIPIVLVLSSTLEDYLDFAKACALLTLFLSLPIRFLYRKSENRDMS